MNQPRAFWNLVLVAGPPLIGAAIAVTTFAVKEHPVPYLVFLGLVYAAGFSLFLKAKLSRLGPGHWISFGPSQMSSYYRRLYRAGYWVMGVGSLVAGCALLV